MHVMLLNNIPRRVELKRKKEIAKADHFAAFHREFQFKGNAELWAAPRLLTMSKVNQVHE
jgi:hypothetical protein